MHIDTYVDFYICAILLTSMNTWIRGGYTMSVHVHRESQRVYHNTGKEQDGMDRKKSP